MGQKLDKPNIEKDSGIGSSDYLDVGYSGMQGYRVFMENEILVDIRDPSLINSPEFCDFASCRFPNLSLDDISFLGVFDGHGGDKGRETAKFVKDYLKNDILVSEKERLSKAKSIPLKLFDDDKTFEEVFITSDEKWKSVSKWCDTSYSAGSTCIFVIVVPYMKDYYEIICCNLGHSRCVLFDGDKTVQMSRDHKADDRIEKKRVEKAGGYVEFGKANGCLQVSRTFADFNMKDRNPKMSLKEQMVIPVPDVQRYDLDVRGKQTDVGEYRFMVIACNGVWDVMSNKEVGAFVLKRLKEQEMGVYYYWRKQRLSKMYGSANLEERVSEKNGHGFDGKYDLQTISEELIDFCMKSEDNITAIIVLFQGGFSPRPDKNLQKKIGSYQGRSADESVLGSNNCDEKEGGIVGLVEKVCEDYLEKKFRGSVRGCSDLIDDFLSTYSVYSSSLEQSVKEVKSNFSNRKSKEAVKDGRFAKIEKVLKRQDSKLSKWELKIESKRRKRELKEEKRKAVRKLEEKGLEKKVAMLTDLQEKLRKLRKGDGRYNEYFEFNFLRRRISKIFENEEKKIREEETRKLKKLFHKKMRKKGLAVVHNTRHERKNSTLHIQKEDLKKRFQLKNEIQLKSNKNGSKQKLGSGSFGNVFGGSMKTEKEVALTIVELSKFKKEDVFDEFCHQFSLVHPNIVQCYGFTEGTNMYGAYIGIVMEKMDCNLHEYITKHQKGRLDIQQKLEMFVEMLKGLQYLHTRSPKVIHRDIKSENFLVNFDRLTKERVGEVKICDFGLVRTMETRSRHSSVANRGTFFYMAPELINLSGMKRNVEYSVFSDIFSLGITFWEILFEQMPYDGMSDVSVASKIKNDPDFRPNLIQPENMMKLPKVFRTLLENLWHHDPKKRPTAATILTWLEKNELYIVSSVLGVSEEEDGEEEVELGDINFPGEKPKLKSWNQKWDVLEFKLEDKNEETEGED